MSDTEPDAVFCADFETTSLLNLEKDGRVRVWLWSLVSVQNPQNKQYGFDIQSFFKAVKRSHIKKIFFHNLKFDGKFIID